MSLSHPAWLHSQLRNDTLPVTHLPLCYAALMNNAHCPWLILTPSPGEWREVVDMPESLRQKFWQEVDWAAAVLQKLYRPDKLNIGALGNIVPQLHVHVIARSVADAAWPKPVWGNLPNHPYDHPETRIQELIQAFKSL